MPQNHQIVIGQLAVRCSVLADAPGAQRLRSSLDAAFGSRLPSALATEAEPVLSGMDAVVRIRRLDVRLDLGDELEAGDVATRLAARIAALLRRAVTEGTGDVMVWAHHDDYLADYLALRLAVRPQPVWPFEELANLDHVPAERAAAELIRARPSVLPPLARIAAARGDVDAVLSGWPQSALAALTAALLAVDPSTEERASLAAAVSGVGALVVPEPTPSSAEAVSAAALRLAVRALAQPSGVTTARAVVIAAAAVLARFQLAVDLKAPHSSADTGGPAGRGLRRATELVMSDPAASARLDEVLRDQRVRGQRPPGGVRDRASSEPGDQVTAADDAVCAPTPYAGLALLMPSVLSLGAADALGSTGLAQAVWQSLADEDHEDAARDVALAMLYPADPRDIDLEAVQPTPPPQLAERLTPAARAVFEAADPTRRWSALLLGDFASRLRGLDASSHGYLRAQFLRHPGTVMRDAEAVIVLLEPVPLRVVLRMAGHGTPPSRVPHLGMRRLVLDYGDRS